ncbi:hypothetical protein ACVW17_000431 [Bradyrhizobium sp. USDA 4473]
MNRPTPIAAVQNGAFGSCFSHSPADLGSSSGSTKNQRNSCTSSGMLRKNSTQQKPIHDAVFDGSVRSTPITEPVTSAMIQASTDTLTVTTSPDSSRSR